jgi:hypothetical protein
MGHPPRSGTLQSLAYVGLYRGGAAGADAYWNMCSIGGGAHGMTETPRSNLPPMYCPDATSWAYVGLAVGAYAAAPFRFMLPSPGSPGVHCALRAEALVEDGCWLNRVLAGATQPPRLGSNVICAVLGDE